MQLITSNWDIGSDGEYGSGSKAGRRANLHHMSSTQGVINADRAATVGAELLWTLGPYSSQAEVMASRVVSSTACTLNFHGFYAQAGLFITGESRPYLRNDAVPGRIAQVADRTLGGPWRTTRKM